MKKRLILLSSMWTGWVSLFVALKWKWDGSLYYDWGILTVNGWLTASALGLIALFVACLFVTVFYLPSRTRQASE